MQGKTMQEIDREIAEGFRTGRFRPPSRPGIAYMLSGEIRNVSPSGDISSFPPHVMFYAPNLTNAEIGVSPQVLKEHPTFPSIAYTGPHGCLIVPTDPITFGKYSA